MESENVGAPERAMEAAGVLAVSFFDHLRKGHDLGNPRLANSPRQGRVLAGLQSCDSSRSVTGAASTPSPQWTRPISPSGACCALVWGDGGGRPYVIRFDAPQRFPGFMRRDDHVQLNCLRHGERNEGQTLATFEDALLIEARAGDIAGALRRPTKASATAPWPLSAQDFGPVEFTVGGLFGR